MGQLQLYRRKSRKGRKLTSPARKRRREDQVSSRMNDDEMLGRKTHSEDVREPKAVITARSKKEETKLESFDSDMTTWRWRTNA